MSPHHPEPATTPSPPQTGVTFTGDLWQFTKIWAVGVSLSLITLGLYSPWAAVRIRRYLHGHLAIDGHRFRYLARPQQILKGRALAFTMLLVLALTNKVSGAFAAVNLILYLVAMPWLITSGLRFKMRCLSHRNVRFSFGGRYWGAARVLYLVPLLTLAVVLSLSGGGGEAATLLLFAPILMAAFFSFYHRFLLKNISYGDRPLTVKPSFLSYLLTSIMAFTIPALGTAPVILVSAAAEGSAHHAEATQVAFFISLLLTLPLAYSIFKVRVRNRLFKASSFPGVATFESRAKIWEFTKLNATNLLLMIATAGLGHPIVRFRQMKYLASVSEVKTGPEVDLVRDPREGAPGAFGEEAAELFSLELGVMG